jgi:hypothetical protein
MKIQHLIGEISKLKLFLIKVHVHWQTLLQNHQQGLHLPWRPWVMQHNYDFFYLCHSAQGSQSK